MGTRWRSLFASRDPCAHQFLPYKQAGTVQANTYGSRANPGDFSHLIIGESLHVAKNEYDPILRRQSLNGIAQPRCLFTANSERFRVDSAAGSELVQFVTVRHKLLQREFMRGSKLALAPTHQAAILRDFIEPHQKCFRISELGQLWNRFQQHLLHGIFGILTLSADAHAERENRTLQ